MTNYSFTAIKSPDNEKILDIINEYVSNIGLNIIEEAVSDRKSKYINTTTKYESLEDYDKSKLYRNINGRFDIDYITGFSLFESMYPNNLWAILRYQPFLARLTVDINADFAQFISKILHTDVIEYKEYSVVDLYVLRKFKNGALVDSICYGDGCLDYASGFFNSFKKINPDEDVLDAIVAALNKYFAKENVLYSCPDNANNRRPLYLNGNPEDIKDLLKLQQVEKFNYSY